MSTKVKSCFLAILLLSFSLQGCSLFSKMKRSSRKSSRSSGSQKSKAMWATFEKNQACGDMVERYKKVRSAATGRSMKMKVFYNGGAMLAKCNKWDYVFSQLLYGFGKNEGFYLMKKMEKAGHPVAEKFSTWLSTTENPYKGQRNSHFAMMQAIGWMKHRRHYKFCAPLFKAAKKISNTHARVALLDYFFNARCKNSLPIVLTRLSDDWPRARRQACAVLGRIGSKAELRKVTILANTDSNIRVRIRCRKAAGEIRLRN